MKQFLCIGVAMLALSACATGPGPKYEWGNYETSMYGYYKNPADANGLSMAIEKAIKQAETTKRPVAPGLYAEYGYLLMVQGRAQDAIANFENEKRLWPESAQLMDKMSKMALAQQPAATGGAK